MKKYSYRRKQWLINRNKKIMRRLIRKNKAKKIINNIRTSNKYLKYKTYKIEGKKNVTGSLAPENFSIVNNPDETIFYFENIIKCIKSKQFNHRFIIDLSEIKDVTIDAVMYLLSIINNIKYNKIFEYTFQGKMPNDNTIIRYFKECGFYNYVSSGVRGIFPHNSNINIKTGVNNDQEIIREICDFVIEKFEETKQYIRPLYNTLLELMSNTHQHAYNDNDFSEKVWYIYVEYKNGIIRFIFLDTGEGIATTVYKRIHEKLNDLIREAKDSKYILSAFTGKFRSETQKAYRGEGLKEIYKYCKDGYFINFSVTSGKGRCMIDRKSEKPIDILNKFYGTMYYWELHKGGNEL